MRCKFMTEYVDDPDFMDFDNNFESDRDDMEYDRNVIDGLKLDWTAVEIKF